MLTLVLFYSIITIWGCGLVVLTKPPEGYGAADLTSTVWIFVFIAVLNGHTVGGSKPFFTQAQCEAQKAIWTANTIVAGATLADSKCVSLQPGKLT